MKLNRNTSFEILRFLLLTMIVICHVSEFESFRRGVGDNAFFQFLDTRKWFSRAVIICFALLTGFFSFRKSCLEVKDKKIVNKIFRINFIRFLSWVILGTIFFIPFVVTNKTEDSLLMIDNWFIIYYFLFFGFLISITRLLIIKLKNILPIYFWLLIGIFFMFLTIFVERDIFGPFMVERFAFIFIAIPIGFFISIMKKQTRIILFALSLFISLSFGIIFGFYNKTNSTLLFLNSFNFISFFDAITLFLPFTFLKFSFKKFNWFQNKYQYILTTHWTGIWIVKVINDQLKLEGIGNFMLVISLTLVFGTILAFIFNYFLNVFEKYASVYVFRIWSASLEKVTLILPKKIKNFLQREAKKQKDLYTKIKIVPTFYKIKIKRL